MLINDIIEAMEAVIVEHSNVDIWDAVDEDNLF